MTPVLIAILAAGFTATFAGSSSRVVLAAGAAGVSRQPEPSPGPYCEEEAPLDHAAVPGAATTSAPPVMFEGTLPAPPIPWVSPSPEPPRAPVPPLSERAPTPFQLKWPIEYVLRPQTIPAESIEGGLGTSYFRPQAELLRAPNGAPYMFFPSLTAGAFAAYGATDRLEVGISAPRILCFSSSQPSGCDSLNRFNGSAVFLDYGWARTDSFQLRSSFHVNILRSEPASVGIGLDLRAKLLLGHVVALELAIVPGSLLGPDGTIDDHLLLTFVTDLNVQVTRHLLVFADLDPYGPVNHLGEPALEGLAGVSWTFESRVEVGFTAGVYNLLAGRSWQTSVPGSFYSLGLRFFL